MFRPSQNYIAVDVGKLPSGSVIYDNNPAGHVSLYGVPAAKIKEAIIVPKGKLPE